MTLKFRMAGAVAALALVSGVVPGIISGAAAYEVKGKGQHFDNGRWPHTAAHYVVLGLGITALVTALVLVTDEGDEPVSP
jgi:ABC-type spermidine/putrescine transport system permease subunit II